MRARCRLLRKRPQFMPARLASSSALMPVGVCMVSHCYENRSAMVSVAGDTLTCQANRAGGQMVDLSTLLLRLYEKQRGKRGLFLGAGAGWVAASRTRASGDNR